MDTQYLKELEFYLKTISIMNNIFFDDNKNCKNEYYYIKNNNKLHNEIILFNINFNNITWACKVYNYINNITNHPNCPECKNYLKFNTFKLGYKKYCSKKCACNSIEFKNKRDETILNKYGVKNISQSNEIKKKKEKTLLNNYGVSHPLKSNLIKERIIKSNLKNFGVANVSQSDKIKKIKKETALKNYGVEHNFISTEIKNKIKTTIQNKYGVDHYVQSSECKKHINNAMLNKRILFWSNQLKVKLSDVNISGNSFTINNYCKLHNKFEINRYLLYNRHIVGHIENICTKCNPVSENSSIKENEVRDFITNELKLNIINNNRKILNGQELDIYIPGHNLAIEFNGLYWHSDLFVNNNYHLNKTTECDQRGIQLLHVFEDEWLNKKEVVKSIIKSKLGLVDNKIYARKTVIKEIDSLTCQNFLDNNHIQGQVNSKIRIGLFYDNELQSVMTFGKKRLAMGNKTSIDGEYEMLRFCNRLNTQVIGGASKLLSYFVGTYQPKSVLTFADRRYSQGNMYKQLGFNYLGNTKPNYWYFKPSEMVRYYRFGFRKDVLVKAGFDNNKTEHEIQTERGYLRIYDCGNMKFELIL